MLVVLAGCTGSILQPGSNAAEQLGGHGVVDPEIIEVSFPISEVRRLTREEYANSVRDLVGVNPGIEIDFLPQDPRVPFDNDYVSQVPSKALIEGANGLALSIAKQVVADPLLKAKVTGCTPADAKDAACFRSFIKSFGRQALRRSLTAVEIDAFTTTLMPLAELDKNFYTAVELAIASLLQHVEFLYRIEIGTPVDANLLALTQTELASRLSFMLWESVPDPRLLDLAEQGQLGTAEQIAAVARQMLADPKAVSMLTRFHALWLGYERLNQASALGSAMRRESDGLVQRVVFDKPGSWYELFRSKETLINDTLADIYGMPKPGGEKWVPYSGAPRQGLLSHAAYLAGGSKFGDSSPVMRGILVRERLMCQKIPPPPANVNPDDPIPGLPTDCKKTKYSMHGTGGCANCHAKLDPIGFGLEQFDQVGRYREFENGRPDCPVDGKGELKDLKLSFSGPAGLADRLIESGQLDDCMLTHLLQFSLGREVTAEESKTTLRGLVKTFDEKGQRLDELLVAYVSSDSFRHRRLQ
jgi:hypothetical protein